MYIKYENQTKPPPPLEILLSLVQCIITHLSFANNYFLRIGIFRYFYT